MTQKNTAQTANQTAKPRAGANADAIVADAGINRDLEIDSQNLSEQPGSKQATTLSPEVIELVAELRDTVRRINPKNHTPKTLRRVLSNVNDILRDINAVVDA